ncbi:MULTISPECIES: PQQ-binding-like beta-propeller repeat protein [unclassified Streptomyces]|uniref:outer membrane protein assembly factor BamB family protein n=1 Tax=unclassified Streptomyces TaxID=2593676 RepID=UPI0037BD901B
MRSVRKGLSGLVVVAFLAVAGCSSGDADSADAKDGGAGRSTASKPADKPAAKAYEAPVRFAGKPTGEQLLQSGPWLNSALAGRYLFTRTHEDVQVTDVATGRPAGPRLRPENPAGRVYTRSLDWDTDREDDLAPFALERADGPPLVLVPYHVSKEGRGTTASQQLIELLVIDSGTGKVRSRLETPLVADAYRGRTTAVRVVGAQDGTVAVSLRVHDRRSSSPNSVRETFGVDLSDPDRPRTTWKKAGFEAYTVAGGNAVGAQADTGLRYQVLTAVSMKDGETAWQDRTHERTAGMNPELQAQWTTPAGPDRIITTKVTRSGLVTSRGQLLLVDAATGKQRPLSDKQRPVHCRYDGKSVVVCGPHPGTRAAPKEVFALDAPSGKILWELPDSAAGRIAPEVTAVRHGRVYADTPSGPVVLDARSGADIERDPGIAPVVVNEYAGLAARSRGSGSGRASAQSWELSLHHTRG